MTVQLASRTTHSQYNRQAGRCYQHRHPALSTTTQPRDNVMHEANHTEAKPQRNHGEARTCRGCGEFKQPADYYPRYDGIGVTKSCKACERARIAKNNRARILANPAIRKALTDKKRAYRATPEGRAKHNAQSKASKERAKERKRRMPPGPLTRAEQRRLKLRIRRRLEKGRLNAHQAWKDWTLNIATPAQIETIYAAKPWNNPRLTESQKYAVRYANDYDFNVKERVRAAITKRARKDSKWSDLFRGALQRGGSTPTFEKAVGYTIKDLSSHLERQFARGMDWPAFMRGEIHIDHIVPKSSFDGTDDEELRACWALTNLRPLWASENLAKSDKEEFLL